MQKALEMADNPLRLLFPFNPIDEDSDLSPSSNAAMVEELVRNQALRSQECTTAFQAVDRRHYWLTGGGSPELAYADMPLRTGRLHLSAPHIYAKALESLMPLKPGMSFLNVGSGTGYFNSIVGELTGSMATNHGVEIWETNVSHARERCASAGKANIEFKVGNVYQLDVNSTIRYDRIYLGACANSRSKYLYRLLEVGGILIGPFQAGHIQQLRRVVRQTETQFNVEVLGSVQFACLIEPIPSPKGSPRSPASPTQGAVKRRTSFSSEAGGDGMQLVGLPDVPFTFALREQPWTPERSWLFPPSYKRAVGMSLRCKPRCLNSVCLPPEIWVKHIFPWCPKWWFETPRASLSPQSAPQSAPQSPLSCCSPSPVGGPMAAPASVEPEVLPASCHAKLGGSSDADNDVDLSDDGSSTHAPSSGQMSSQHTSQSRPSQSLGELDASEVDEAAMVDDEGCRPNEPENCANGVDLEDVLFEVFSNGQRHAIGADGDPDDADTREPDDHLRLVVPLHILHLLAEHNRRSRPWAESDNEDGGEEEDEEEDDGEEEEVEDEVEAPAEEENRMDCEMEAPAAGSAMEVA